MEEALLSSSAEVTAGVGETKSSRIGDYGRLKDNPFFTAGFGLMGMGVILTGLRHGVMMLSTFARRRLLVSLEIPNRDRSYEWVLSWIAHHSSSNPRKWMQTHRLSVETGLNQKEVGSGSKVTFNIVSGTGMHYFKYNGAWIQIHRERETKAMNLMTQTPWEIITLTTLSRDRHLFSNILSEARDLALTRNEGKLTVHTAWGTEWRPFGKPRRKRPLSSVVLDNGISERVHTDLQAFLQRRGWYTERGVPYRRGYLLHGPPGSGKTSFIQALAGSVDYDVCLLNLSERGLSDDKLNHLLSNLPERCFVLIEDIDAAFNKRVQTSDDGYQSSVTFSGFLNALDGVASGEERICFLTTNHLDRLDPALIRPGRVDVMELLDDATPRQAKALFERFYGESSLSTEFLQSLAHQLERTIEVALSQNRRVSMAALQGHFIRCEPREAVRLCSSLFVDRAVRV